jgi:hypothetical protein
MKTVLRLLAPLCLPIFLSCGREPNYQNESTTSSLTDGQWKVRTCTVPGMQSGNITTYNLEFRGNNSLTVIQNGTALTGTWSLHQKVVGRAINLGFNTQNSDLSALSKEWNVEYMSPDVVKLSEGGHQLELARP